MCRRIAISYLAYFSTRTPLIIVVVAVKMQLILLQVHPQQRGVHLDDIDSAVWLRVPPPNIRYSPDGSPADTTTIALYKYYDNCYYYSSIT